MVSSEIPSVTTTHTQRPKLFTGMILLPKGPPDVVLPENVEFDFNDVFGATAVQTPTEVSILTPGSPAPLAESNEEVYNDPVVITKRSHSLVGPTSLVSQSLPLSKLTLHESDSSLDLLECLSKEKKSGQGSLSDEELNDTTKENEAVGLDDFELLKLVGQGAFGKVYQLRYSFQTKYRLYLVLDFVNGGHLFFQLYQQGLFREELGRIYTAEIVSAVAHLHANGIMHRDLKPENILLDAHGHAMLTDFGLAKEFDENTRSNSMCGTVEYMAPEIVQGRGHDKAADWWSVGILLFEMLTGKPPFFGGNRDKIQQNIVKEKMKLPTYLSSEVHSLLKGLLHKEAGRRLGSGPGGSDEIKNHKWFKAVNWKKLEARQIKPSFCPNVAGQTCIANFDECWTSMPVLDSPVASPVAADSNFVGFSYVRPEPFLQKPSPLG
ncbi:unnamed protein product [Triticum turgidum subsp. durum]|uniref:non-specific serine/threonine protein kinase n=1 Tax=Triticum turgidum subsp. durum TaxID=4567 RepID=A0A9R0S9U8_TRITD|nr:unnamed protein product [Triticum turgidum subsp. durum]